MFYISFFLFLIYRLPIVHSSAISSFFLFPCLSISPFSSSIPHLPLLILAHPIFVRFLSPLHVSLSSPGFYSFSYFVVYFFLLIPFFTSSSPHQLSSSLLLSFFIHLFSGCRERLRYCTCIYLRDYSIRIYESCGRIICVQGQKVNVYCYIMYMNSLSSSCGANWKAWWTDCQRQKNPNMNWSLN